MYTLKVPTRINQIFSVFYFIGMWSVNQTNFRKWFLKTLYLIVYTYYPASIIAGACTNDNEPELMFLVALSVTISVVLVKFYYILWKQDQIHEFIQELGTHLIADINEFNQVNKEITIFIKLATYMCSMTLYSGIAAAVIALPIFTKERVLPVNLYFPVDWKHNDLFYCMAFVVVTYFMMITVVISLLNVIVWYLMMSCGIKYRLLEKEFKNLGFVRGNTTSKESIIQNAELIDIIKMHQNLQEYKNFHSSTKP